MHFKETAIRAGNTGTVPRSGRSSSQGGAAMPQCSHCGKDIMESVGHEATHHPTKTSQKGGWKCDRKGNGKGIGKGGKPRERKR